MNGRSDSQTRIAVIGGGIAGLSAALRLRELAPRTQVTLFEAGERLGGTLRTEREQGFVIEHSADMFTTAEPWAMELCRRIGFADQLIETNLQHRRAFVVRRGRLYPVPAGFALIRPTRLLPMLATRLLTPWGKLRLFSEYFLPGRRDIRDESLADFARRRLGREAYERLVQPLVGGIYTADPEKLSMAATLPAFLEMERLHGGLLRAAGKQLVGRRMEQQAAGVRYGAFVAPREGMSSLVGALAARLDRTELRLATAVRRLSRSANAWDLTWADGTSGRYHGVILACSAPVAARLLADTDPPVAEELERILHASAALVVLGYDRGQIRHPLNGFGFVVPARERRRILAASFASVKFEGRAPAGQVLLRVFIGGALQPELLDQSDDQLLQLARDELLKLLGARGAPRLARVIRWPHSMPQYHVGHLERVERIEQRVAKLPHLALAGNAYRGVGIPFCVRSGELAAEAVLSGLR